MATTDELTPPPLPAHDDTPSLPPAVVSALFDEVASRTVSARPSPRDRLRELPTPWRALVAVSASVLGCAVYARLIGLRGDLQAQDLVRFAMASSVVALGGMVAAVLALRGMHQRQVPYVGGVTLGLLLLPVAASWVPGLWPGAHGAMPMEVHLGCGLGTLVAAFASASLVALLDRDDHPPPWRVGLAGAAGGAFGFVTMGLHCPAVDPVHLLLGHGLTGLLMGALLQAVVVIRAR